MSLSPISVGSRKLQKSRPHWPISLATACMPYGMREVEGFGEDVWEFFNRQYEVIGAPFRFLEPLTNDFLVSVSYDGTSTNMHSHPGSRMVIFGTISGDRELKTLRRVSKVMNLTIETEIEDVVQCLPTTWDREKRKRLEEWDAKSF